MPARPCGTCRTYSRRAHCWRGSRPPPGSSPRRLVLAAVGAAGLGLLGLAFAVGGAEDGEVVPPVDVVVVDHVARTGGGPVIQPVDLDR